jgi:uncharacterized membrane protein YraQ (UPF0718 family)
MSTQKSVVHSGVFYKQRAFAVITLMAIVGITFWMFSRYPALNSEVQRAQEDRILERGPIGLITKTEKKAVVESDSFVEKVYNTTYNWVTANKTGMLFGLIFGGAFQVFLIVFAPYISFFTHRGPRGSFLGMIMGMPLGVCANCVSPIGVSGKTQGMGLTSVLSMMLASPTMNVLSFVMLFTLFPAPMAILRILAILFLIFIVVPIIVILIEGKVKSKNQRQVKITKQNENLEEASIFVLKTFVIRTGVLMLYMIPLMFIGGFLGAVVVNIVPLTLLAGLTLTPMTLIFVIFFAALLGAFLPVPTFSEFVFVFALMMMGVHPAILATLLVVLPATSIFSYLSMKVYFPKRVAGLVFSSIVIVGFLTGLIATIVL